MRVLDQARLYLAVVICCIRADRKAARPSGKKDEEQAEQAPACELFPSQESSVSRLYFSQEPQLVRQTKHLNDVEHLKRMLESGPDNLDTALRLGHLAEIVRSDLWANPDIRPHAEFPQLYHAASRRRKRFC